ncbi:hypothetical protein MSAN_01352600 [Mycena sanguinolenta]|uniref:Uncharacterized protein n=1 Tax=Mycena sanguinolenta TaxID=230812 RepID=A0A8H6YFH1_9AGAR|nr:hypothetical protein MSAN_01352600 [Mycena sanguinolenta]
MDSVYVRKYRRTDLIKTRHLLANVYNRTVKSVVPPSIVPLSHILCGAGVALIQTAPEVAHRWVPTAGALLCAASAAVFGLRFVVSCGLQVQHKRLLALVSDFLAPPYQAIFLAARRTARRTEDDVPCLHVTEFDHDHKETNIQHLAVHPDFVSSAPKLLEKAFEPRQMLGTTKVTVSTSVFQLQERLLCDIRLNDLGWWMQASTMSGLSLVRQYKKAPPTIDLEDPDLHTPSPGPAFILHLNELGSESPSDIPHTERLLRAVARSIQDPTTGVIVSLAFRTTLMAIDLALQRQHKDLPSLSDLQLSYSIAEYMAARTPETWFPPALDKPWTGQVEWGTMNLNRKKGSRLGFGVPAINANLVSQFEETFRNPPANTETQACLSVLIVMSYLHELFHAWVREVFKDTLPADWTFPPLRGASSASLDVNLMGGQLHAHWDDDGAYQEERFLRISGLWLGNSTGAQNSLFQRLEPASLEAFHQAVMGQEAFNLGTEFANLVRDADTTEPEQAARWELEARGSLVWASSSLDAASPRTVVPEMIITGAEHILLSGCALEKERKLREFSEARSTSDHV